MAFSANLSLKTERLVLNLPPPSAAERIRNYYVGNRSFHAEWDPPRPRGFYSAEYWKQRLKQNRYDYTCDVSMRLFLFEGNHHGPVVGTANFSSFVRGPFLACRLGYGLGEDFEGQGLMTEALRAALDHVFSELGFHRVEANYVPTNERSGRLLRRLGFTVEGYARDYLYIDGAWRDHVLTSLTTPNPQSPMAQ